MIEHRRAEHDGAGRVARINAELDCGVPQLQGVAVVDDLVALRQHALAAAALAFPSRRTRHEIPVGRGHHHRRVVVLLKLRRAAEVDRRARATGR